VTERDVRGCLRIILSFPIESVRGQAEQMAAAQPQEAERFAALAYVQARSQSGEEADKARVVYDVFKRAAERGAAA
jgi:hypothetical protein